MPSALKFEKSYALSCHYTILVRTYKCEYIFHSLLLFRNLYYESAPAQLVVSPGAGSYTRHLEQQQRRQQQQQLRLARGTGRQPQAQAQPPPPRRPRRNDAVGRGTPSGTPPTSMVVNDDPLGDRRVAHPVDRIRQGGTGQEYERWALQAQNRVCYAGIRLQLYMDRTEN